jgi:hypothetical protein
MARDEHPLIVDLDESVYEVLRRVELTGDPSDWITAAVKEKAEREDRASSHDVVVRVKWLLAELARLVELEQEFAEPAARPLWARLAVQIHAAQATVEAHDSLHPEEP